MNVVRCIVNVVHYIVNCVHCIVNIVHCIVCLYIVMKRDMYSVHCPLDILTGQCPVNIMNIVYRNCIKNRFIYISIKPSWSEIAFVTLVTRHCPGYPLNTH